MRYKQLKYVARYCEDRISRSDVSIDDYISTENMLPEKGGVTFAANLPEVKTLPKYVESDILLSNIRPYFKKIWFANRTGGCSNDVLVVKSFDINPKFLFYVLSDNNFFNYSTVTSKGTKMPRGSQPAIMKYLVPDINDAAQTRIADILSTYDNAIENNRRRIALLEKAAQELYKEWFVRFRFPGHENTRFVNGLPEGWERVRFKGNIAYNTGKLDSNAMVTNGRYSFYTCAKQIYATDTFHFDGECVLLGGNNATGDFSLFYANEKLDAYQRTYIVTPINSLLSCPYIFFVLKDYLLTFQITSAGAATKFLTKAMLDRFYVILSTEAIARCFKKNVQPMFDLRVRLQKENSNLARQRDMLLPRLMSGKLEV